MVKRKESNTVAGSENGMREERTKLCGIVMPISEIGGYPAEHWAQVKKIFEECIAATGYQGRIVSDANEVSIIHTRIIQNLYNDPIVICDVSAKNPNVMFELGLRLAFDKPTIIVKDDVTDYSFDTSPVEHLSYPSDLNYNRIVEFKALLANKITATLAKSADSEYSPFLKQLGGFSAAKLNDLQVSESYLIAEELFNLQSMVANLVNVIENDSKRVNSEVPVRSFASRLLTKSKRLGLRPPGIMLDDDDVAREALYDTLVSKLCNVPGINSVERKQSVLCISAEEELCDDQHFRDLVGGIVRDISGRIQFNISFE